MSACLDIVVLKKYDEDTHRYEEVFWMNALITWLSDTSGLGGVRETHTDSGRIEFFRALFAQPVTHPIVLVDRGGTRGVATRFSTRRWAKDRCLVLRDPSGILDRVWGKCQPFVSTFGAEEFLGLVENVPADSGFWGRREVSAAVSFLETFLKGSEEEYRIFPVLGEGLGKEFEAPAFQFSVRAFTWY